MAHKCYRQAVQFCTLYREMCNVNVPHEKEVPGERQHLLRNECCRGSHTVSQSLHLAFRNTARTVVKLNVCTLLSGGIYYTGTDWNAIRSTAFRVDK
jgi:hypothetical protein